MPTLVVTTQGAYLRCADGQVLVEYEREVIQRLPVAQVERVLLLGRIGLSTGFLDFALAERIPVTFLSQDGAYKGRLDPGGMRDVALRLAQYRGLEDLPWRLGIARPIVRAKLLSQRAVLMRSHRNRPRPELAAAAEEIESLFRRVERAETLPELMGLEGSGARVYFGTLPLALCRPLSFRGRSRRPPKDPMNALLSLGYGLLTAEIIGALLGVGLDPQIGIFHSPRGRVPALAHDLLELFRAPVADSLALSLANLGIVKEDDFTGANDERGRSKDEGRRTKDQHPPDQSAISNLQSSILNLPLVETHPGVTLTKPALATFFRQYRRRMQAGFRDREGRQTSFRRQLQSQAAHLRRVILREEEFEPFIAQSGGPDRGAARSSVEEPRPGLRANQPADFPPPAGETPGAWNGSRQDLRANPAEGTVEHEVSAEAPNTQSLPGGSKCPDDETETRG